MDLYADREDTDGPNPVCEDGQRAHHPQESGPHRGREAATDRAPGLALEKLDAHLDVMAERGDIVTPDMEQAGRDDGGEAGRIGLA
ncbi:hypothetical protein ACIQMV_38730 [Streptomyces sp. NPDC091412]|uniref:hypothetical protein n=1 Tax=Streptomyces sp. NPDC091412 TaxID=3366002 RepID=UPI003825FF53